MPLAFRLVVTGCNQGKPLPRPLWDSPSRCPRWTRMMKTLYFARFPIYGGGERSILAVFWAGDGEWGGGLQSLLWWVAGVVPALGDEVFPIAGLSYTVLFPLLVPHALSNSAATSFCTLPSRHHSTFHFLFFFLEDTPCPLFLLSRPLSAAPLRAPDQRAQPFSPSISPSLSILLFKPQTLKKKTEI